ncbi:MULTISPECIES: FtsB family cell division protein [Paenibacillus]|uniref:Septum formation initiator family protein n=1 Tax=Paenibacillus lutrae TaxID=2078573 RepID=A0A7X3FM84_9BACL|nr:MULTISPECIES: septum formation initiator family protein [Paenibacillus]MVP02193.1 septum formation initiator family protein [Paenibacillus lutrae]
MPVPSKSSQSQTKSNSKGTRRRFRIAAVISLGVLTWAGVTYWDQSGKLGEKRAEMQQVEQQLADEQKRKADITKEIARLNDPEYLEQVIRSELNYAREGETRFISPAPKSKNP